VSDLAQNRLDLANLQIHRFSCDEMGRSLKGIIRVH